MKEFQPQVISAKMSLPFNNFAHSHKSSLPKKFDSDTL